MASKQNLLIQTLLEQNQRLNATQLANQLGVSVRTVHNYINTINGQYPGAISSTANGYHIAPQIARKALNQSPNEIPQTAVDRCNYILNRLVQQGGSLNLYDLCDEIYISATTFHSLMGKMRRMTRDYDLTLTVSGDIVSLTGTERNKRRLLSGLLYHESATAFTSTDSLQAAFPSIDVEEIRADVMTVLNANHYFINDYSLINLLLHIAIAINRVQNGCINTEDPGPHEALAPQEAELARQLIEQLETHFNIRFSPAESYELALLLISRTSVLDYSALTADNISHYIGEDCIDLVRQLIRTVKEFYDINLDEPEFFVRFALHMHNLLVRAQNRSFCKNPLVSEIRQTCPLIYDVSVQLSGIIREQTGITLDEDEIAYIALHLGGALETQKELANRVPAVLYCPSYYNMDSSLADRLSRRMDGKILLSNVFTNEADLEQLPGTALVISTVRTHRVLDHPLVLISPFLTNSDIIALNRKVEEINTLARRARFRQSLTAIMSPDLFEIGSVYLTREDVIHHMCGSFQSLGYAGSEYEAAVLERETISATAFGQFAIPHTLKMHSQRTGMAVYISRTPIQWGDSAVNFVIMLSFNSNDRKIFYDVFEPLSMLLLDANNLKGALACRTYDAFIDYLVERME